MANSGVRLTFKFNINMSYKIAGWSESLDLMFATLAQAINSQAAINNLVLARLNCLGAGVTCVDAYLTADPGGIIVPPRARRATFALTLPEPYSKDSQQVVYNKALQPYSADYVTTVLYYSAQTDVSVSPVYRRNIWIAGMPDAADDTAQKEPKEGPWVTAFAKYMDVLGPVTTRNLTVPGIVGIRSVDQSGGNPVKFATGYNPTTRQFTVPAHGFLNGQLIEAIGFRATPGNSKPSGRYKVVRIDADTIALAGAGVVTTTVPPGGFRAIVYAWNAINSVTQKGFSKRDKGGPFNREVGRHKKPVIARA